VTQSKERKKKEEKGKAGRKKRSTIKKRHIGKKKEKIYQRKGREDAIFEATEEDKETKAKKLSFFSQSRIS